MSESKELLVHVRGLTDFEEIMNLLKVKCIGTDFYINGIFEIIEDELKNEKCFPAMIEFIPSYRFDKFLVNIYYGNVVKHLAISSCSYDVLREYKHPKT